MILLSIVFTSKKLKNCCASFHSSRLSQNVRKKALKKNKKRMSFEIFNQYRKNRLISNENDANLTEEIFTKKELFESTSNKRKTAFVVKKIMRIKCSMTISSLKALQMLFHWLIIMSASKTSKTLFFDEYNITKFLDHDADLCQNYNLEKKKKIRRLSRTAISSMNIIYEQWLIRTFSNEKSFARLFVKIIKTKILINNCIF